MEKQELEYRVSMLMDVDPEVLMSKFYTAINTHYLIANTVSATDEMVLSASDDVTVMQEAIIRKMQFGDKRKKRLDGMFPRKAL